LAAVRIAGGHARLVGVEGFDRAIEIAELGLHDLAPEEAAHVAQLKAGSPTRRRSLHANSLLAR